MEILKMSNTDLMMTTLAAHLLVTIGLLLIYQPVSLGATEDQDMSHPMYFGITNDVTLLVKPGIVYDGFTTDLTISCIFSRGELSDFKTVHTLILSKAGQTPGRYSELAAITSTASGVVKNKMTLGAEVTGRIEPNSQSFIKYKWAWPDKEVSGRYYCEAHGLNVDGYARISTATAQVVIKEMLDTEAVNETMRELDTLLTTCTDDNAVQFETIQSLKTSQDRLQTQVDGCSLDLANCTKFNMLQFESIDTLEASREELQRQLDDSRLMSKNIAAVVKDEVLLPGTTWHEHTYFLSKPVPTDILAAHSFCVQLGGYLVRVNDAEEYRFVADLIDKLTKGSSTSVHGVAIGSWDMGHEGNWTFIGSEKPMTYFDWSVNEPSNYGEGKTENCVVVRLGYKSKRMNDFGCKRKGLIRFMCEIV